MNIAQTENCTNCGSCLNTCPQRAISADKSGLFYRMVVDNEKCIDCGACVKACPLHAPVGAQTPHAAYCAQHRDLDVRAKSSSGGAFSALAEQVIANGGVVFGAVFRKGFTEVGFDHTDRASLDDIRRSKYVESLVDDTFLQIRKQLNAGRQVMFCGTPCQAAGLRAFLGKTYDTLLVCDFICGGLPSHRLFREYISHFQSKKKEVVSVNFRSKAFGWTPYYINLEFAKGKPYLRPFALDPYFSAFLHGKCSVRESCLQCPFAENHASDITLADFWAWKNYDGVRNDETGLSLVIVNTRRGEAALSADGFSLIIRELPQDAADVALRKPVFSAAEMRRREAFLRDAQTVGLLKSAKLHTEYRGFRRIKQYLKKFFYANGRVKSEV